MKHSRNLFATTFAALSRRSTNAESIRRFWDWQKTMNRERSSVFRAAQQTTGLHNEPVETGVPSAKPVRDTCDDRIRPSTGDEPRGDRSDQLLHSQPSRSLSTVGSHRGKPVNPGRASHG